MQQIRGKKSPTKSPPSYCHQIYFVLSLQSAAPKNTQLPSQRPRPHRREAPFPAGPGGRPPPHNEFAAAAREGCAAAPPGSGRRSLGKEADPEAGASRAGRGFLRAAPPTPPRGAAAPSPGTAGSPHRGDGPHGAPLLPPYADVRSPQRKSPSCKTPRTPRMPNGEPKNLPMSPDCITTPHVAARLCRGQRPMLKRLLQPPGRLSSARRTREIKKANRGETEGARRPFPGCTRPARSPPTCFSSARRTGGSGAARAGCPRREPAERREKEKRTRREGRGGPRGGDTARTGPPPHLG